ncbi:unnamed protein product [Chrysoparadoxa australica]
MVQRVDTDVAIVGSGPHGLAVAARLLHEAQMGERSDALEDGVLALLSATPQKHALRVCVLDEHGGWMEAWDRNFEAMRIPHLRSRVTAHPDPTHEAALLDFAMKTNRTCELQQHDPSHLPGSSRRHGRRRRITHSSMAELHTFVRPSSALFSDFCGEVSSTCGSVIKGTALALRRLEADDETDGSDGGRAYVITCTTCTITAGAVVLACGNVGHPRVPRWASSSEQRVEPHAPLLVHTCELCSGGDWQRALSTLGGHATAPVAVIGAGMSGCWLALALARCGRPVTLIARSGLRVQQYDTGVEWSGRLKNQKLFDFWAADVSGRAALLRAARGVGHGTVTPELCSGVREAVARKDLELMEHDDVSHLAAGCVVMRSGHRVSAKAVVLATGTCTDCMVSDLIASAMALVGGVQVHDGLPAVGDDLRLHADHPLFIVGALAALGVGPHAHNLDGARVCSRLVADAILAMADQEEEDDAAAATQDVDWLLRPNRFADFADDDDEDSQDDEYVERCQS